MTKSLKEAARIYADLKKDFDMEEELYYQKHKIDVYNAFLSGARAYEALHICGIEEIE